MILAFLRLLRISSADLLMDWTIRLAHPARFEYIQEGAPLLKTRSLGDMVVVEIGWKTDFLV